MFRRGPPPGQPRVPDGTRVYAIGDVHGCDRLLEALHGEIRADIAGKKPADPIVMYLGDYIDRGPNSARTLDLLTDPHLPGVERVCLLGNHEQAMLDFLLDFQAGNEWLEFGGRETLASYGIDCPSGIAPRKALMQTRRAFNRRLPVAHFELVSRMPRSYRVGDFLFVHAGIRPGVPLDLQDPGDLIWIRDAFLRSEEDHGCVVVHGHSPTLSADERANRIGIDTGAVWTGCLTCLVLEGAERRYLQTSG